MADELTTYFAGGYFLVKPVARDDDFMDSDLLPQNFISLSTCLTDAAFEFWWSPENVATAADFGVPPAALADLTEWYTDRFGSGFGAPNVAFSVDVVQEFLDRFVTDPDGLVILGCGLTPDQADRLLGLPAPAGMGEYGVDEMIQRRLPLAPAAHVLGFEVVSYEHGLEHSWLCGGFEREVRDRLGITSGGSGLLRNEADARAVAEYLNRGDVPSEPGTWFPWLVVRYPLQAT